MVYSVYPSKQIYAKSFFPSAQIKFPEKLETGELGKNDEILAKWGIIFPTKVFQFRYGTEKIIPVIEKKTPPSKAHYPQ